MTAVVDTIVDFFPEVHVATLRQRVENLLNTGIPESHIKEILTDYLGECGGDFPVGERVPDVVDPAPPVRVVENNAPGSSNARVDNNAPHIGANNTETASRDANNAKNAPAENDVPPTNNAPVAATAAAGVANNVLSANNASASSSVASDASATGTASTAGTKTDSGAGKRNLAKLKTPCIICLH